MRRISSPARVGCLEQRRLAEDLLRGLSEIADYIGESPRRAQYLAETGRLPTFKVGQINYARKSEIDEAWSANRQNRQRAAV